MNSIEEDPWKMMRKWLLKNENNLRRLSVEDEIEEATSHTSQLPEIYPTSPASSVTGQTQELRGGLTYRATGAREGRTGISRLIHRK